MRDRKMWRRNDSKYRRWRDVEKACQNKEEKEKESNSLVFLHRIFTDVLYYRNHNVLLPNL